MAGPYALLGAGILLLLGQNAHGVVKGVMVAVLSRILQMGVRLLCPDDVYNVLLERERVKAMIRAGSFNPETYVPAPERPLFH